MSAFDAMTAPGVRASSLVRRRLAGRFDIDAWGLDPELIDLVDPMASLRWDIRVDGAEHLPGAGGALIVHVGASVLGGRWALARGIRQASGRFVRTAGVFDLAPIGPLQRRLGAVAAQDVELEGLLRAGQLVAVPLLRPADLASDPGTSSEGEHVNIGLDGARPDPVAVLARAPVPIVPAVILGHELARRRRIVIGPPIAPPRDRAAAHRALAAAASAIDGLVQDTVPTRRWGR